MWGGVPPYYNFADIICDFRSIGIDAEIDDDFARRLSVFFRYSISKLAEYELNEFYLFNNKFNIWLSCRNFSYNGMLALFGVDKFSPQIEYCNLKIGKTKVFGLCMSKADGMPAHLFHKNKKRNVFPTLQKELLNLNTIDYLCLIRDHTVYNYNVITDEYDYAIDVCCFDNNEPGSFSSEEVLFFKGNHGESPLINKEGIINRPYFDAAFATKVNNLKRIEVYNCLKNHLTLRQIYQVWKRIVFLNSAIKKTAEIRPNFLLNESQWNDLTIAEECSGKYGKTYLYSLIGD